MNQNRKMLTLAVSLSLLTGGLGGAGGYLLASTTPTQEKSTPNNTYQQVANKTTDHTSTIASIQDSVVEIRTKSTGYYGYGRYQEPYSSTGAGSGVIINKEGYIVTNNHVVEGSDEVSVTLTDGTELPAKVIKTDPANDLALLKIDTDINLTYATLGNSEELKVGEYVFAIGNPLGTLGGTVTEGIISAKNRNITIGNETMNLLQTSAAINSGNSGGGLFDSNGTLIGIVNAKTSGLDVEGLGFAIPIDTVKTFLSDIPYSSSSTI